ncbi:MAG TPA: hypothetical protein VKU01_00250 [Bryobacteraceae bacterium]|nr:hypothetical protein [Bryobacteraceae bacterium]
MLRSFLTLAFAATLNAAIWPAQFKDQQLKSEQPVPSAAGPLWQELGLEAASRADYGPFQATAYRFADATDAYAAWQDLFESKAQQIDNYLVTCEGRCPSKADFQALTLPKRHHATLPTLGSYLPVKGLEPHSERYVLGPATLSAAAPEIPPALAVFQLGTEAQVATYRTPRSAEKLVLLSFPTPQLARQQAADLEKLPGAVVRRAGPIVAVVPGAQDAAAAKILVSQIGYQATVNWDEKPKPKVTAQGIAQMILAIFELAGILIVFCALAGFAFAGYRLLGRKLGHQSADEPMILLHLMDR